MAEWNTCAAVRWTVLFLLMALPLAQSTEGEVNLEENSFYTEITIKYPEETTYPSTPNTEVAEDPRRSERMVVVYVKSDPNAETKNIAEFLDSDDIVYKTGSDQTVVITDSEADEDEIIQDDGDFMAMVGRSLNDKLPSEAGTFESENQPNLVNRRFNIKDALNKWSSEIDFNLSDLLKVNLASLLADEYEEMDRLMRQNLVEDTNEFMQATMTDILEPRDVDDGKLDMDQTVAGSSEVVQVLPVPVTTLPLPILRSPGRIAPQYTYPVYSPVQRSDSAPSYIFLPRIGSGQPVTLLPTGNVMRLPPTLPRTVAQRTQATTAAPSRLIRRPQIAASNQTTTRSPTRFGERFVGRLPRPFRYMLNRTVSSRQTTTEKPFRPSTVSQLLLSPQSYPARQRVPNRHFQRPTTRNHLPPPSRMQGVVATMESRFIRPRVTTEAPSSNEFGARIRPFQYERVKNSTNITQSANKSKKVEREVKMDHLRSNLVGKLVAMQSILDDKQEKSGKIVKRGGKLATTQLNRSGLPNGILKPIVPLRPRVNFETTSASPTQTVTIAVPVTPTEFSFKDKKKYRRPPSFRKGGSYKLSAEKLTEDSVTSNPTKPRESMVILQIVEATPTSSDANSTKESVQLLDDYLQQTLMLSAAVKSDVNKTTTELTNTTDTTTTSTEDSTYSVATTVTSEPEITVELVEILPIVDAGTTGPTADLEEPSVQNEESTVQNEKSTIQKEESAVLNFTETTTPRDSVREEQPVFSTTLEPVDTSPFNVDLQETTTTSIENATETVTKIDEPPTPLSILEMVDTSVADQQEITTVQIEENQWESQGQTISTKIPEITATILKDTLLSAETATEDILRVSASTDVPDGISMKKVIERTNESEESKASVGNQKINISAEDFLDNDDEDDDESDFDFPDLESDSIIETNEERLSTDKTLSRFDRSVGSISKDHSKMTLDALIQSQKQNIFPLLNLARGVVRPINLPYHILPESEEIILR